jgi:hypothetical protein
MGSSAMEGGNAKKGISVVVGRKLQEGTAAEMKSLLLGFLGKCGALVAALVLVMSLSGTAAWAVTKGSTTAIKVVTASGKNTWNVKWGGNMTGWKRGTLVLDVVFYVDGREAGSSHHQCNNSTSCSVPDKYQTFSSAKGWQVTATGCGPGGCDTSTK